MWPTIPHQCVQVCDPRLSRSGEIPPEAVGGGIFDFFCFQDNFQPEVVGDAKSGVVVEPTGMKVRVEFVDSGSNRSRDIRLPQMRGERTTPPA